MSVPGGITTWRIIMLGMVEKKLENTARGTWKATWKPIRLVLIN